MLARRDVRRRAAARRRSNKKVVAFSDSGSRSGVGKLVSTVVLAVGLALQLGAVTVVAVGAVAVLSDRDAWSTVLRSWVYWVVIGGLGLIALRRIMFRSKNREL